MLLTWFVACANRELVRSEHALEGLVAQRVPHPDFNILILLAHAATKQGKYQRKSLSRSLSVSVHVCTISLRFKFRYFSQIQIWTLAIIN